MKTLQMFKEGAQTAINDSSTQGKHMKAPAEGNHN